MFFYFCQCVICIKQNLLVSETNYLESLLFQPFLSNGIFLLLFLGEMVATIKFDNNFTLAKKEINNITAYDVLS